MGERQVLRFYLALFLFMIFQNLIYAYGVFIFEFKEQKFSIPFFFSSEFKLGFLKKGQVTQVQGEGVQICIARGSKQFFFL